MSDYWVVPSIREERSVSFLSHRWLYCGACYGNIFSFQEHIIVEGTCRARGITENSTVYTKCPPNFDVNNLAPLDIPRQAYAKKAEVEVEGEPAAEPKPTEDILTDSTEAEEDKTEAKTALQIDFEKTAGVWHSMHMPNVSGLRFSD